MPLLFWKLDLGLAGGLGWLMVNSEAKHKIALVVDVRNWAFHNIAEQIKTHLSERYEFDVYYFSEYKSLDSLCHEIFFGKYELVHFFWRAWLSDLYYYILDRNREWLKILLNTPLTFSVYDHTYLDAGNIRRFAVIFELACGFTISSERLKQIYDRFDLPLRPTAVIADGVDLGLFFPVNLHRLGDRSRDIVVGWVGNSKWYNFEGVDHKGLYSIIRPAIAELRADGVPVTGVFADRNVAHIPVERMVDYYNSIDIYVCASDMEGTPNPVLEAMACGVPVISTDVGIVPQLFGPKQSAFILRERSIDCLKEKLRELVNQPEMRLELSRENIEVIKGWTREQESVKWDAFFRHIIEQSASHPLSSEGIAARQRRLQKFLPESKPSFLIRRTLEIITRRINIIKFNLKYGP